MSLIRRTLAFPCRLVAKLLAAITTAWNHFCDWLWFTDERPPEPPSGNHPNQRGGRGLTPPPRISLGLLPKGAVARHRRPPLGLALRGR